MSFETRLLIGSASLVISLLMFVMLYKTGKLKKVDFAILIMALGLVVIGSGLNFTVMALNGKRMPVYSDDVNFQRYVATRTTTYYLPTNNARLAVLADKFQLKSSKGVLLIFSIGDIFNLLSLLIVLICCCYKVVNKFIK